jgi:flagellar biosynthesis protein FlhF
MSETLTADGQLKTYRGASIEEVLPLVRAELGPEAVIVRRREGLIGGIGGFFQKRCVEVDAEPGGPRIDVYDDGGATASIAAPAAEPIAVAEPAEPHPLRNDAATREGMATPAMRRLVGEAQPFADLLDQVVAAPGEAEAPAEEPAAEPRRIAALKEGMVAAGLGADLAADLVDSVLTNVSPFFSPGRLRTLVRNELALRLPAAAAPGPGRRRLAVVGPAGGGKSAAVARIARAHAGAGQQVACISLEPADRGASLRALLEGSDVKVEAIAYGELAVALLGESAELVLIDTPPASRGDAAGVESLAATLGAAGLDEIHMAVRAGTAAPAASEMLEALRPLGPGRILVTVAADTSYIGAALDVAIRSSLPIHYVAENAVELAPADPRELASKVMP